MYFNTSDFFLHAAGQAALAVCWAAVLVSDGMLLAPVQAWLRAWYRQATRRPQLVPFNSPAADQWRAGKELDDQWWWKPLWGCYLCVSGQAGLWGYVALSWHHYHLLHHLYFISLTLLFAALWRGLYAWATRQ